MIERAGELDEWQPMPYNHESIRVLRRLATDLRKKLRGQ
jgi:hypothetical protein